MAISLSYITPHLGFSQCVALGAQAVLDELDQALNQRAAVKVVFGHYPIGMVAYPDHVGRFFKSHRQLKRVLNDHGAGTALPTPLRLCLASRVPYSEMKNVANLHFRDFGWEIAHAAVTRRLPPLRDGTPYRGLRVRHWGSGFVHRSRTVLCRTVLCRAVPNLS